MVVTTGRMLLALVVQDRDAAKHPTMHRTAPPSPSTKTYPAPNVNISKAEKP